MLSLRSNLRLGLVNDLVRMSWPPIERQTARRVWFAFRIGSPRRFRTRVSTGSDEVEEQIVSSEGEDDEMCIRLLGGLQGSTATERYWSLHWTTCKACNKITSSFAIREGTYNVIHKRGVSAVLDMLYPKHFIRRATTCGGMMTAGASGLPSCLPPSVHES